MHISCKLHRSCISALPDRYANPDNQWLGQEKDTQREHEMTKATLQRIKVLTTWGGVLVTSVGVVTTIHTNGSVKGSITALVGICITAIGHLVGHAIDRKTQAERKRDQELIEELQERVSSAEALADDPAIKDVMNQYAVEHQDDGR